MSITSKITNLCMGTSLCLLITACGGDNSDSSSFQRVDYGGSQQQAVLSSQNQDAIANSAYQTSAQRSQQVSPDELDVSLPFSITSQQNPQVSDIAVTQLNSAVAKIDLDYLSSLPVAAEASDIIDGTCGGTLAIKGTGNESSAEGSLVFTDYCDGFGATSTILNGKVTFKYRVVRDVTTVNLEFSALNVETSGESILMTGVIDSSEDYDGANTSLYISIEATMNGETMLIAGRETCANNQCTNSDFITAASGEVFRLDDFSMVQDGNLYDIDSTFFHPTYGYTHLTGNDLALCDTGFSSGTLSLNDGSQTLTLEFSSCGQFTQTLSQTLAN